MSGGSYDYMYSRVEEEYADRMFDSQLNTMMKYLAGLLHELEWWQSGDYNEETYREAVKKFKKKWLKQTKIDVWRVINKCCEDKLKKYIFNVKEK